MPKYLLSLIFMFISISLFSQSTSILEKCTTCTQKTLSSGGGLMLPNMIPFSLNESLINKDKKCMQCVDLPKKNLSQITNRIAARYAYANGSIDSVNKYMQISFEASPYHFCKENFEIDDILENDTTGNSEMFHPMYIRYLSEKRWEKQLILCKKVVPDALVIEEQPIEQPSNNDYYQKLLTIGKLDQQYRSVIITEVENQEALDQQNRVTLDQLFEQYGLPTKETVTSEGVKIALHVLLHSTDCNWSKKWIIRYLDGYAEGKKTVNTFLPIDRFFKAGDDAVAYQSEKLFCKDAVAFLEQLQLRYSADVAQKFGFSE